MHSSLGIAASTPSLDALTMRDMTRLLLVVVLLFVLSVPLVLLAGDNYYLRLAGATVILIVATRAAPDVFDRGRLPQRRGRRSS